MDNAQVYPFRTISIDVSKSDFIYVNQNQFRYVSFNGFLDSSLAMDAQRNALAEEYFRPIEFWKCPI